ncbi:hypothetical protein B0T44_12715 [Nocardia donostiensis]|uniref:Uncharacterized protein n=1 Tax=Nocardia donostiensis TaxID=1538463 RepID=A0A1V2TJT1_9NOCA|nr:hypothetical protein B0T46_05045 [Nocardia donostiensis]OQS15336.1 hypothetical protein B0T36_08525 [Nocardia donostiensis]OQS19872.1 hypothetical protein B0T44_12715 [Nocardia donostiensis]
MLQVGWLFWSLDETFGSVERLGLGGRKLSEQDQPPGDAMSREHHAFAATRPKRVAGFDAGDEPNRIAGPEGRIGGLAELFDDAAQLR